MDQAACLYGDPSVLIVGFELLVSLVSLAATLPAWRWRRTPGLRLYPLISLGIVTWAMGRALGLYFAASPALAVFWARLATLGMDLLPLLWLAALYMILHQHAHLKRRYWLILFLIVALGQALVWFGPPHSLIALGQPPADSQEAPLMWAQFWLWKWLHIRLGQACMLIGSVLLTIHLMRVPPAQRRLISLRLIGFLALIIVYLVEINFITRVEIADLTPLTFTLAQWGYLYSSRKGVRLVNLPLARDRLVETLEDGVLVLDAQGRIADMNPSAYALLQLQPDSSMSRPLAQAAPGLAVLWQQAAGGQPAQGQVLPESSGLPYPLEVRIWPVPAAGSERSAYLVLCRDISTRQTIALAHQASETRFHELLEFAPAAILLINEAGIIQVVNQRTEMLLGYAREQLVGQSIEILVPDATRHKHVHVRQEFIAHDGMRLMGHSPNIYARRSDGSNFPVDVGLNTIHTPQGTLIFAYLIDITARKAAEQALQLANGDLTHSLQELEARNRELTLLGELGEVLQSCSTESEAYVVISAYARSLFNGSAGGLYIADEVQGHFTAAATWGDLAAEAPFPATQCWGLRRRRAHWTLSPDDSLQCTHVVESQASGIWGYVCVPLQSQKEVIGLLHVRGVPPERQKVIEQIAFATAEGLALALSNLRLREDLRMQAIRDALTGLFNRRYMEESFERELRRATRYTRPVSVLMMDIDRFKSFNDSYGHAAGDMVLRTVADYVRRHMRGEDILCRYGGEEFLFILPDTSLKDSLILAEKLRQGISELRIQFNDRSLGPITVSLGAAAFPDHGLDAAMLMQAADEALYQAKAEGRNKVVPKAA